MDQQHEGDEADVTERLEFLLATRIRYELIQRAAAAPAHRAAGPDTDVDPVDPEQELRAAEFLLATRALREVHQRALRQGEGTAREALGTPPR